MREWRGREARGVWCWCWLCVQCVRYSAHLVVVDPRKCLRRRLRCAQRLLVVVHLGRIVGEVRLDLLCVRVRGVCVGGSQEVVVVVEVRGVGVRAVSCWLLLRTWVAVTRACASISACWWTSKDALYCFHRRLSCGGREGKGKGKGR